jgi:HTTM domain
MSGLVLPKDWVTTAAARIVTPNFQSLSAFRVALAGCLLGDYLLGIRPFFDDFYGEAGILPLSALLSDPGLPIAATISRLLDALGLPLVLPYLYPLALFTFGIGYRTRLSNAVVLLLNSYLYWRNVYVVSGAEDLARLLLIWCLFLPLNRYWSVDAALDPQPRERPYPVLPFVALRLQIVSLYVFSGLFKLAGARWLDGSAVAIVLTDNMFGATPVGLFLAGHFPGLLVFVTYATIAFQLALPFLVYSPWYNDLTRAIALAAMAAMHASFLFCLNIGAFPFVSLATLILLVPDSWWDRLLARRRERLARIQIFFEPGCGFCERISLLLREFLLAPSAKVMPASADPEALRLLTEHNSWVVRGADGSVHLKWQALVYLMRENLLLAPLGWLTDLSSLRTAMARLYDAIGGQRRRLGALARRLLPIRTQPAIGPAAEILCGTLMWLALVSNVMSLNGVLFDSKFLFFGGTSKSVSRNNAFDALQIGQSWRLFAPMPVHAQHHYRIRAELTDGSIVDLMSRMPVPIVRSNPDGYAISFVSHRWLKFFSRFDDLSPQQWSALGRYFCRKAAEWDAGLRGKVRAIEIAIFVQAVDERWSPDLAPTQQRTLPCGVADR